MCSLSTTLSVFGIPRGVRQPRGILLIPGERVAAHLHAVRLGERDHRVRVRPPIRVARVAVDRAPLHDVAGDDQVELARDDRVVRRRIRAEEGRVDRDAERTAFGGSQPAKRRRRSRCTWPAWDPAGTSSRRASSCPSRYRRPRTRQGRERPARPPIRKPRASRNRMVVRIPPMDGVVHALQMLPHALDAERFVALLERLEDGEVLAGGRDRASRRCRG